MENVIDAEECAALAAMGHEIIQSPRDGSNDWDWRQGESLEKRAYRIVQCGVDQCFPWIVNSRFRAWAARFGAAKTFAQGRGPPKRLLLNPPSRRPVRQALCLRFRQS